MQGPEQEIEEIKTTVARFFPVYEVRVRPDLLTFFVHADASTLDANFDELRKLMIVKKYIPFITKEKGEHLILIQRRPQMRAMGTRVNLALLCLTIVTTIIAGAVNWAGYDGLPIMDARSFAFGALFFALPLLAILGIHEMGHYITAKKYSVAASLPFFIPSIPPLGTFGAVISMRDPIPNRKALLDIGISGPLFGLAVAIPVTIIGLFLIGADPKPVTISGGDTVVLSSLLYDALTFFVPVPAGVRFHPTAFAGWVGLFVTALNLLPAGQLDGGHVARAILGDKARYLSYFSLISLLFLGLAFPEASNWLIIAILILVLGARHPPPLNDITKLKSSRVLVGVVAAAVFAGTFIPVPFASIPVEASFNYVATQPLSVNVTDGGVATASFTIVNNGNVPAELNLTLRETQNLNNINLTVKFLHYSATSENGTVNGSAFNIALGLDESVNVTLIVDARQYNSSLLVPWTLRVHTSMLDGPSEDLMVTIRVV